MFKNLLTFTQEKNTAEAILFYLLCLAFFGTIEWLSHFSLFGFLGERNNFFGIIISVLLSTGLLFLVYKKKMSDAPLLGIFILTVIFSAFGGIVIGFVFPAMLTTKSNKQPAVLQSSETAQHNELIFSQLFCFAVMLMTISPAIMSTMLLDVEPSILEIIFLLSLLTLPISFFTASVVGFIFLKSNKNEGKVIAKKLLYVPALNIFLIILIITVETLLK